MNKIRKTVALFTIISLFSISTSAFASDETIREVFTDAFYGAGIGGLVGGALMVFTKKPADHFKYIAYGGATGVLLGTTYGLVKSARAFAEVENGRVKFAFPSIIPKLIISPDAHRSTVAWNVNLIHGSFK